jgi:histidinol phosphatase-like PHP family hydrolase
MSTRLNRRQFLATAAACTVLPPALRSAEGPGPAGGSDLPLVDLHVHLDNSTIDRVLGLAQERGVKFGIVEHAGTKANQYPVVLSNDSELQGYLAMLEGKPVFKGVQAEWTDWMGCFSRATLARLDYVLTDTMTFPGKDGQRVKLWLPGADSQVDMADREAFMERYVDWHVEILSREPIDILANVSWLPEPMARDYERFWTEARVKRVLEAALKYGVALEISSSFKLPKLAFLRQAKAAGVKFTFGSNGRYPNMGKLDYSLEMARALGLQSSDLFTPAPPGQRAVERRKL